MTRPGAPTGSQVCEVVSDRAPERGEVVFRCETECDHLSLHFVADGFSQLFDVLSTLPVQFSDPVSGKLAFRQVLFDLGAERPELLLHFGPHGLAQVFEEVPTDRVDQSVDNGRDLVCCLSSLFDKIGPELDGLGAAGLGELPSGRQQTLQIRGLRHVVLSLFECDRCDRSGARIVAGVSQRGMPFAR